MSLSYDQITATTRKHFIPKLVDNIFTSNVLTHRLLKKSKSVSGGEKIVEPLIYSTGTTGFYNDYDVLDISPTDEITAAEYDWKFAYAAITISRKEELQNSGPEQVINLLKAKMQIAEKSLKDTFGDAVFSESSNTSSKFRGFYDLIENYNGTVGGINSTTYSWWQSQIDDCTSYSNDHDDFDHIVDSSKDVYLPKLMRKMWSDCSEDQDSPTLIVTTPVIFDAYDQCLSDQKRFGASSKSLADAGFLNLLYRNVPVVADAHCPDGHMYMLNENYLQFRHHKDEFFRFEGFQKPINQNVRVSKIFWAGALTCSNRRYQGVINDLPTSY